jgi:hypothetical protein
MRKIIILVSTVTLSMIIINWSGMIPNNNFNVINDAVQGIKKTLIQDQPYFIKRTYHTGNNEIKITTKGHYKEYRKKAYFNQEIVNAATSKNPGEIIEFIYKSSNKNQIIKINKTTKKRQKIDFHMDKQELEPTGAQAFFNLIKM